jgi:hypothetical protein
MQGRKAQAIVEFQKAAETGDVAVSRAALAAIRKLRE